MVKKEAAPDRVQSGVCGPRTGTQIVGEENYVGGMVGLGARKGTGKVDISG